jgi:predicted acetyltransferase
MTRPTEHVVTPLGPEHLDQVLALDRAAFVIPDDPGRVMDFLEWDRTFGVLDGAELIGLSTTYSLTLTLPAGPYGAQTTRTPMAGLSWVAVHPGYRRRGVLRALVGRHLHGLHEADAPAREPVSGLFSSEPPIYGRFGYGQATSMLQLTADRAAELRSLPGGTDDVRVRFVRADPERHTDLVADLYARACAARPGMVDRPLSLTRDLLRDTARTLERQEPLRLLLAERDDVPTGYVLLRREVTWTGFQPGGRTEITELAATDRASAHRLWCAATDFDLTTSTTAPLVCDDDPVLMWLVDTRAARPTRTDALWLRVVDVDRALAARSYAVEVDVVLGVTDRLCPWNEGRWRLSAGPTGAVCAPTTDAADLTLDVRELASALPGGTTLVALAAAGLVHEERLGTLARLSTAFRSAISPGTTYIF